MGKLTSIAEGGLTSLNAGIGGGLCEVEKIVDLSLYPSTNGDFRYIVPLPAGTQLGTWYAKVLTADSVSAGTLDVGLYAASNDSVIDVDAFANELAVGSTGIKAAGLPAGYATQMGVTVDAYIGLTHGAGSTSELNDAKILFKFYLYPPAYV